MRLRDFPAYLFALALLTSPGGPATAQTAAQVQLLAKALSASASGEWTRAATLAGQARSPVATDLVLWIRLRDGAGKWSEYEHFLARHGDWPGLATLRRAGERLMPAGLPPEEVFAYFGERAPETGIGALRLAAALADDGQGKAAEAAIVRAWRELSLSPSEQKLFRAEWSGTIKPEHEVRLDNLLWQGWTREAEAMLPLVDEDWQKLAQARIATRRDSEGLQYAINQVPASLKGDPGLAFERYL
jgi:peptidoglycan lytic transglycosylase